ncbi:Protein arginine N-methyltransferase 3 [Dionaea muscipula]
MPSPSNQARSYDPEELHLDTEGEEEEEEDGLEAWDDWKDDGDEETMEMEVSGFKCLFCDSLFYSSNLLFDHCASTHRFDFRSIRKCLRLNFYRSLKLINYVRCMVAENRCWSCRLICNSNIDLLNHLHGTEFFEDLKHLWEDDKYLQPFMQGDSLLYSFDEDEDDEDEDEDGEEDEPSALANDVKLARDLSDASNTNCSCEIAAQTCAPSDLTDDAMRKAVSTSTDLLNGVERGVGPHFSYKEQGCNHMKVSLTNVAASEIKKVNESYFGSYSSYSIHREMLSDKARMDAYSKAILNNPSLLKGSVVMDVGCGTGILSLFAAQVGASRVLAVEASDKMAVVARQIAKDNGLLWDESSNSKDQATGVVNVVHGMVEELDKSLQIEAHSIDILLSEWMGYCLLYESMLSSVLFARDKWLKPGGAILPDTASMFAAGFGGGGTSLPFWENVYGFNMSCVGKELLADASEAPIIDIVEACDIVTKSALLQTFDLVTMKLEDMDFTSFIELEPNSGSGAGSTWCYGVVLWFETGFTSRFCKEMPTVLSTSPFTSRTHWSQTILTFKEPIVVSSEKHGSQGPSTVGTCSCPAWKILLRISIVRAAQHRAIDISLETTAVGHDGKKRSLPIQIFNLC